MEIQLIIADDHKIIRDGLKALVEHDTSVNVVAEASNGREVIDLVRKHKPHIVIMDVSMPELNGIEATKQIVFLFPDVKVIALSMHSDRRYVSEMLKAGASGYMFKDCAYEDMRRAFIDVMDGKIYLSSGVTGVVVDDYVKNVIQDNSPLSILTDKELEVMQLLVEGFSTKEIACKVNKSIKTIETHRKNIMDKLDVQSLAALTKIAIREGITQLDA